MIDNLKSHFMLSFFKIKEKPIGLVISMAVYLGIMVIGCSQKVNFISRTNYDNILITNILVLIITLRMLLGAISIPYEIVELEYKHNCFLQKSTMFKSSGNSVLFLQITLKILRNIIVNIGTISILILSVDIFFDIKNICTLIVPIFLGTFILSIIGYFLAFLGYFFEIKREFMSIIQVLSLIILMKFDEVSFLNPYSIVRERIYDILSSDLIFGQRCNGIQSMEYGYLLLIFIMFMICSYHVLLAISIVYRNKQIKGRESCIPRLQRKQY